MHFLSNYGLARPVAWIMIIGPRKKRAVLALCLSGSFFSSWLLMRSLCVCAVRMNSIPINWARRGKTGAVCVISRIVLMQFCFNFLRGGEWNYIKNNYSRTQQKSRLRIVFTCVRFWYWKKIWLRKLKNKSFSKILSILKVVQQNLVF